ncbi:MAG TPA: hypothetical protein GX515_01480 [Firmicutes bacterium]|nr:hypothetical protein [Bacillota bacterium]
MRKAFLLTIAVAIVLALAGGVSAAGKIGVGYYFHQSDSAMSLAGELGLSDRLAFGFDYVAQAGEEPSKTELYGKLALKDLGVTSVGAFGGVKMTGASNTSFKVGLYGEQPITPQIDAYARAGAAFEGSASSVWLEALGGVKVNVMSPFWLAGEALYNSREGADGTAFRVIVGMNF